MLDLRSSCLTVLSLSALISDFISIHYFRVGTYRQSILLRQVQPFVFELSNRCRCNSYQSAPRTCPKICAASRLSAPKTPPAPSAPRRSRPCPRCPVCSVSTQSGATPRALIPCQQIQTLIIILATPAPYDSDLLRF